jgi:hypothetical protein
MNHLAIETIEQIGGYLDASSVLRFSSTNEKYRTALRPLLFRTIRVKFSSPETLKSSAERWLELLTAHRSFCHVRFLYITSSNPQPCYFRIEDCGDRPLETWKFCNIIQLGSQLVSQDDQWKVLVELIKSVPALRKLTWGCREQMPPCVLRYIDENLLQCQVYLANFHLRSLIRPSNITPRLDSYDLELATSRCIYGITMQWDSMIGFGWANYNKRAVIDMVAGAAPNLQEVSLHFKAGYHCPPLGTPVLNFKQGQIAPSSLSHGTGALRRLEIMEQNSGYWITIWNSKTNFGVLQSLKVHYNLTTSDFRWLVQHCRFFSLHTLAIRLATDDDDEELEIVDELTEEVKEFLATLPPLRSVKLTGLYTQRVINAVLDLCSHHLRQLLLGAPPTLGLGVFASIPLSRQIQEKCPRIEELTLPMMRSHGSVDEVAIYQSFGQMKFLRKLQLSMYVPQPFLWDEDVQGVGRLDDRIQVGEPGLLDQLHRAIMDLAMDKTLAASIFNKVVSDRNPPFQGLECLDIRVSALDRYSGYFCPSDIVRLLQYIGRSWTCTRDFSHDRDHHCHVTKYDPEDQARRKTTESARLPDESMEMHVLEPMLEVWPEGRRKGWKEVWHSFPLDDDW